MDIGGSFPNIQPPLNTPPPLQDNNPPPQFPISSLMSALFGYNPNEALGQHNIIPYAIDNLERQAVDFFQNPGTGKIGMARGRPRLSFPPDIMQRIAQQRQQGISTRQISSELNVDRRALRNLLNREGISTSRTNTGINHSEIAENYNAGMSLRELARENNVSVQAIRNSLSNSGIATRGPGRFERIDLDAANVTSRYNEGQSAQRIADDLNVSRATVTRRLGQTDREHNTYPTSSVRDSLRYRIRETEQRMRREGYDLEAVARGLNQEFGPGTATVDHLRGRTGWWHYANRKPTRY